MHIRDEIKSMGIKDIESQTKMIKALNVIGKVSKTYGVEGTDFIPPELIGYLEQILNKHRDIKYLFSGGYDDAEYAILMAYPDFIEFVEPSDFLCILEFEFSKDKVDINHRDVLGSLMGLGIVREKVGDIIIGEGYVQIFVKRDIAEFLEINFIKVKRSTIEPKIVGLDEIRDRVQEFKEINTTVKSLRLDAVASSGFNVPRNKAAKDIKAGKVKVNHIYVESSSHQLSEGDLISYRGQGRIILTDIGSLSKKDRIRIEIRKFL